jgi:hypothetical protein
MISAHVDRVRLGGPALRSGRPIDGAILVRAPRDPRSYAVVPPRGVRYDRNDRAEIDVRLVRDPRPLQLLFRRAA